MRPGSAALLVAALSVAAGISTQQAAADEKSSAAFGFSGGPDIRPDSGDETTSAPSEKARSQAAGTPDHGGSESDTSAPADTAWWKTDRGEGFRLLRAGPYGNAPGAVPAVALMFSQPLAAEPELSEHLRILGPDGNPVEGQWRLAPSPYVAYFTVPSPGRYRIEVTSSLASANGNALGVRLSGPVIVR